MTWSTTDHIKQIKSNKNPKFVWLLSNWENWTNQAQKESTNSLRCPSLHTNQDALCTVELTQMKKLMSIPSDMMVQLINVPTAPNNIMVMKLRKNCFFFTWNLAQKTDTKITLGTNHPRKPNKNNPKIEFFFLLKIQQRSITQQTHPALNMIGGKRYIKNRSSLKTNRCELLPPLISKITTPVQRPCHHQLTSINEPNQIHTNKKLKIVDFIHKMHSFKPNSIIIVN